MPDALKRIFAENLYPKQKDRNWERVADRCGDELCGEMMEMFPHQEQALCATVHAMASLIMMGKKEKRMILLERIKDAILERMQILQEEEDEGPGDEDEEEIDADAEVDFASVPERPSPEPSEDDDDGIDDDDPNESEFNDNKPSKVAGYQPPKRRPGSKP